MSCQTITKQQIDEAMKLYESNPKKMVSIKKSESEELICKDQDFSKLSVITDIESKSPTMLLQQQLNLTDRLFSQFNSLNISPVSSPCYLLPMFSLQKSTNINILYPNVDSSKESSSSYFVSSDDEMIEKCESPHQSISTFGRAKSIKMSHNKKYLCRSMYSNWNCKYGHRCIHSHDINEITNFKINDCNNYVNWVNEMKKINESVIIKSNVKKDKCYIVENIAEFPDGTINTFNCKHGDFCTFKHGYCDSRDYHIQYWDSKK